MKQTHSQRSFARVEVRLPVRVRTVNAEEARAIGERLGLEPSYTERLSTESAASTSAKHSWERLAMLTLLERMERLEAGLETVAKALGVNLNESGAWLEGETVSLSGSGMGLRLSQQLEEGTLVEIEVTLLGETTGMVRLLGRIVALGQPDGAEVPVGRFHLGVSFEVFHEEDQEAIVHYTFRMQRAQLRELRAQDE